MRRARHPGLTYIPVEEMLSNTPGFRSFYEKREIHFEEVYTSGRAWSMWAMETGSTGREGRETP